MFTKRLDRLAIGSPALDGFDVEVGGMDYGFDIGAMVGTDFLVGAGAAFDLERLEIRSGRP